MKLFIRLLWLNCIVGFAALQAADFVFQPGEIHYDIDDIVQRHLSGDKTAKNDLVNLCQSGKALSFYACYHGARLFFETGETTKANELLSLSLQQKPDFADAINYAILTNRPAISYAAPQVLHSLKAAHLTKKRQRAPAVHHTKRPVDTILSRIEKGRATADIFSVTYTLSYHRRQPQPSQLLFPYYQAYDQVKSAPKAIANLSDFLSRLAALPGEKSKLAGYVAVALWQLDHFRPLHDDDTFKSLLVEAGARQGISRGFFQ